LKRVLETGEVGPSTRALYVNLYEGVTSLTLLRVGEGPVVAQPVLHAYVDGLHGSRGDEVAELLAIGSPKMGTL
jgi:hypothetical protein